MKLILDENLVIKYKSFSQKVRILTEQWVGGSVFCPNCGHTNVSKYPNNKPVADFYCSTCGEDYELKSKQKSFGEKVVDGAYRTMIERLQGNNSPNFFLLSYDPQSFKVLNFVIIPKHFFVPEIIEKRSPLKETARRFGWVGCNILLENIPQSGKIFLIKNELVRPKESVLSEWKRTLFLREEKEISTRGWLLDVMRDIEKLGKKEFSLEDIYVFEKDLSLLHPENLHIKDKIRQQLQILRDRGYIRFLSRGRYKTI